ncbi:HAD family hydrolase [Micromonospora sp. NPDC000089]|uniref:HAD family hydrolase n=1 Tax=unclassified Micromonospora TaxID=2617518 RepID=UPI0036C07F1D
MTTVAVDHIVWDWNGTIFGDSRALIDATIDAFAACGLPAVCRADYQRHHTQPITDFYERLAGRELTDREQQELDRCFHAAYARHRELARVTTDAVAALSRWNEGGRSQSLLSMYPHDRLVPLVTAAGIDRFFTRIDGTQPQGMPRKAPHLARHLRVQGLRPDRVVLIGDSVDDARAARECGTHCLLYHPGPDALHARDHFADVGVPVVETLRAAVELVLDRIARPTELPGIIPAAPRPGSADHGASWVRALHRFADLAGPRVTWALTGSAALALHGVAVTPKDVDVITDLAGIEELRGSVDAGLVQGPFETSDVAADARLRLAVNRTAFDILVRVRNRRPDGTWSAAATPADRLWLPSLGLKLPVLPLSTLLRVAEDRGRAAQVAAIRTRLRTLGIEDRALPH